MRPFVVGPSPVITPSRTMASASAALLWQDIFEVSMAVGRAETAAAADIGTLLFSCSDPQHFHAGVNEWLTVESELPFAAGCGLPQRRSQGRPAPMGQARGNI